MWSPTQGVYPLRSAVARMLGYQEQNVHVIYKEGSGCYGLNGADTASLDAALMSKHVGKPVRVQWMRHDEHVWEHFGNPMVMKVRGGLDANGELIAWDYNSWSAGRGGRPGNVGAANLPTGHLIGLTTNPPANRAPVFPPLGAGHVEHGGRLPPGRAGQGAECAGGLPLGPLAVLHRPAPLAGADPELVRERELHRRARGRGEGGSGRVPAPLRR